jgi:NADH dehydrogenase/NADH:ubiquinone oxidoreductase subunit G
MKLIGALTSKVYTFKNRKWELQNVESCDIFDDLYSRIRVEIYGVKIVRVVPVVERGLNEEWISNKVRFGLDGMLKRRLYVPLVRYGDEFISVGWFEIMRKIYCMMESGEFVWGLKLGRRSSMEEVVVSKRVSSLVCFNVDSRSIDGRFMYINYKMEEMSVVVLVNVDLRRESPLLEIVVNNRMVEMYGFWVEEKDMGLVKDLCNTGIGLGLFMLGRNEVCKKIMREKRSLVIYGMEESGEDEYKSIRQCLDMVECGIYFFNKLSGDNMKHEMGFYGCSGGFGIYNIGGGLMDWGVEGYMIYQGSHGERGVRFANCVLPSGVFLESEGLYLSSFGEVKVSGFVFDVPGMARVGWKILGYLVCLFRKDESVIIGLSGIRKYSYEISPAIFVKGYFIGVVEFVELRWRCIVSYLHYDFYVNNYYKSGGMGELSEVLKVVNYGLNVWGEESV